jgi:hypothetical protein
MSILSVQVALKSQFRESDFNVLNVKHMIFVKVKNYYILVFKIFFLIFIQAINIAI